MTAPALHLLAVVFGLLVTAVVCEQSLCEGGTFEENVHKCYYFATSRQNYVTALQICEGFGTRLVSIHSEYEQGVLHELARNHFDSDSSFWVGLSRLNGADVWEWSDGGQFDYNKWAKVYPTDKEQDKCVAVLRNSGRWYNTDCKEMQLEFICERDATKPPKPQPVTPTNETVTDKGQDEGSDKGTNKGMASDKDNDTVKDENKGKEKDVANDNDKVDEKDDNKNKGKKDEQDKDNTKDNDKVTEQNDKKKDENKGKEKDKNEDKNKNTEKDNSKDKEKGKDKGKGKDGKTKENGKKDNKFEQNALQFFRSHAGPVLGVGAGLLVVAIAVVSYYRSKRYALLPSERGILRLADEADI